MPKKGSSGQRVKPLSLYLPPEDPVFAALLAELAASPYDRQSKLRQWIKQGYLAQQAGGAAALGIARDFVRIPVDAGQPAVAAVMTGAPTSTQSFAAASEVPPMRVERERPAPFGTGRAVSAASSTPVDMPAAGSAHASTASSAASPTVPMPARTVGAAVGQPVGQSPEPNQQANIGRFGGLL